MKKMQKLAAALVLILGMASSGSALADDWWWPPTPVHRAPEIDPAGAIAGLTLLAGGLALVRGRRGRK